MAFDNGASMTTAFQFEHSIDGGANTVYGAGSNGVSLEVKGPDGVFGVPDAKTQDVTLYGTDGVYANPDYMGLRQIHLPVIIRQSDEATLVDNLLALQAVWVPAAADVQLAFSWVGTTTLFWFFGRPRGMTADLSQQRRGAIRALLRFDCPNPILFTS